MKIIQLILFTLLTTSVLGQFTITGIVKDYQDKEVLPLVSIKADTTFYYKEKLSLLTSVSTLTNDNGTFTLRFKNLRFVDLTFSFIGYVPLTIKNINVDEQNHNLDLGVVYLPYRGQWFEGYRKIKRGKDKSTIRKERKAWKKEGIPNYEGFTNDFLEPYQGNENALIEYPPSGSKKYFLIKNDTLIIDFEEFIKNK
jgi:hypothetical protein